MNTFTDSASSEIWLNSNQVIKINSYISNFVSTLNVSGSPIIHIMTEADLDAEFHGWDELSDEALVNFEQDLI